MGLDMYLTAKEKSTSKVEVAYWRKANQIHNWFVSNVQNGEDDCDEYAVTRDQLLELYSTVMFLLGEIKLRQGLVTNGQRYEDGKWVPIKEVGKVITNPDLAAEILPTSSGFFFGSTEYDEYYYSDLVVTKKQLESIFEDHPDTEVFYYQASW